MSTLAETKPSTPMSSLAEIENAIAALPIVQQQTLLLRLSERLADGPSCYDLMKDLFEQPGYLGSSGLGDLSTNKKYLDDLGQSKRKLNA